MADKPGKLICLEGFEGAGKTTRAEALSVEIEDHTTQATHLLREPGGDPFAEKLREILKFGNLSIEPWAEALSFNAARYNMLATQVAPRLATGEHVVLDRTYISSMTYQGYGNNWSESELDQLRQLCMLGIQPAQPDIIVVLDVSIGVSERRRGKRNEGSDRFESRPDEYLRRVVSGYLQEAVRGGYPVVNADKSEAYVDAEILKLVLPIFQ